MTSRDGTGMPAKLRADVQGLRAVAVLLVIFYHADGLLPGGFIGVDVFFVISGFVILASLLREHERTGSVSLASFYRRRVHRLTPALALCVGVVLLLSPWLAPLGAVTAAGRTGIAATFLVANMQLLLADGYFSTAAELNPLLHTWSLSLEEQFYLAFPVLVALLLGRRMGRSRRLAYGLITASLASLTLMLALSGGWQPPGSGGLSTSRLAFFLMPARAWQFGVGALLAAATLRAPGRLRVPGVEAIGLGILVVAAALMDAEGYPGWNALVPTIATAMVLAGGGGSMTGRLLSLPTFVWMGDRSYSWYLWHWPAIVFAGGLGLTSRPALAAVGLSTAAVAAVTYRHVEVRFRDGWQGRPLGWVSLTGAGLLIGIAGLLVTGPLLPHLDRVTGAASAAATRAEHTDRTCREQLVAPELAACRFGDGEADIVLLGDSNAGQLTDAIVAIALELNATVTVVTHRACPLVGVDLRNEGALDTTCRARTTAALSWLQTEPPDVIVLAAAAELHLQLPGRTVELGVRNGPQAYEHALRSLVVELEQHGTEVLLVHAIPKFDVTGLSELRVTGCNAVMLQLAPTRCVTEVSRQHALRLRAPGLEVEQLAVADTNAVTLDPFEVLCQTSPCTDLLDDVWRYRDSRHLSVAGAKALIPPLRTALRGLLTAAAS